MFIQSFDFLINIEVQSGGCFITEMVFHEALASKHFSNCKVSSMYVSRLPSGESSMSKIDKEASSDPYGEQILQNI